MRTSDSRNVPGPGLGPGTRAGRGLLALFVLLAIEVGIFAAYGRPIIDEGVYLAASELLYSGVLPYRDFPFSQGPTVAIVYGALLAVFDTNYWFGRFVAFLFTLVALAAAAAIANRIAGRRAAGITILFSMVNLPALWISTTVRTQSLSTPLALLAVLSLTRNPRTAWAWALAPSLLLWSTGTRLTNLLALIVVSIWVAYSLRKLPRLLGRVSVIVAAQIPLVLAPALIAPREAIEHIFLAQLTRLNRLGWVEPTARQIFERHIEKFFSPQGDFFPIIVLAAFSLVLLVIAASRGWRPQFDLPLKDSGTAELTLLLLGLLLYVNQLPLKNAYLAYFGPVSMFLVPAGAIAIAKSFDASQGGRRLAIALVAGVLAMSLWTVSSDWRSWIGTGDASTSHFREVASELRALAGPECTMATFETHLALAADCLPLRGLEYSHFSYYPNQPTARALDLGFLNRELLIRRIETLRPELIVMDRRKLNRLLDLRTLAQRKANPNDRRADLGIELSRSYRQLEAISIPSGRSFKGRGGNAVLSVYVRRD